MNAHDRVRKLTHQELTIMKLTRFSSTITTLLFCFFITACASSNVTSEMTDEQKIDNQLKEIQISKDAQKLVVTETNEEALREELVCKSEKQIGTKFKKKVCYTRAEIEAKRAASREEANELQRQRTLGNSPSVR